MGRVIITKRKTYQLADDAKGVPVEDYFCHANLTAGLQGALVYQTEEGPVIARQPTESDG